MAAAVAGGARRTATRVKATRDVAATASPAKGREAGYPAWPKAIVLWHYPVLLAQAAAMFLACYHLERSGPEGPGAPVVWSAAAALAINTVWLVSRLLGARGSNVHDQQSQGPRPLFWITNNLVCVLLAEVALLLAPNGGVLIALAILLANSVVDLYATADSYVPQATVGT